MRQSRGSRSCHPADALGLASRLEACRNRIPTYRHTHLLFCRTCSVGLCRTVIERVQKDKGASRAESSSGGGIDA
jgi:hypothetical protein